MEIHLDTMGGAQIELAVLGSRVIRSAVVTDIPAAQRSDPYVLARAIAEAGGPQLGESCPSVTGLALTRIISRPSGATNSAELQFVYEGPGTLTGQMVLSVEDSTTLATEVEEIDLNGAVIQAIYNSKESNTPGTPGYYKEKKLPKTSSVPVQRPRRVLTVSGVMVGRAKPMLWSRQAVGQVNDSPWPSGSLWDGDEPDKPGYWLCTHVSSVVDRYALALSNIPKPFESPSKIVPYRVRASWTSKVFRDWSSYAIYRNLYGNVPTDIAEQGDKIKQVIDANYSMTQNHDASGLVKVGMYRPANFTAIFGF